MIKLGKWRRIASGRRRNIEFVQKGTRYSLIITDRRWFVKFEKNKSVEIAWSSSMIAHYVFYCEIKGADFTWSKIFDMVRASMKFRTDAKFRKIMCKLKGPQETVWGEEINPSKTMVCDFDRITKTSSLYNNM